MKKKTNCLITSDIESLSFDVQNSQLHSVFFCNMELPGSLDELLKNVDLLVGKGCQFFAAYGPKSEELHDEIDNCLYMLIGKYEGDRLAKLITTYHNDESLDEALRFFFGMHLNTTQPAQARLIITNDAERSIIEEKIHQYIK